MGEEPCLRRRRDRGAPRHGGGAGARADLRVPSLVPRSVRPQLGLPDRRVRAVSPRVPLSATANQCDDKAESEWTLILIHGDVHREGGYLVVRARVAAPAPLRPLCDPTHREHDGVRSHQQPSQVSPLEHARTIARTRRAKQRLYGRAA